MRRWGCVSRGVEDIAVTGLVEVWGLYFLYIVTWIVTRNIGDNRDVDEENLPQ